MRVLVGCEFSGVVRDAFRARGHNAWSCDIIPAEPDSEYHLQGDVLSTLDLGWDLAIFHPPCTFLSNSGVRWLYNADGSNNSQRWADMRKGAEFFKRLLEADIPKIAVENPVMHKYAKQIIGQDFTQSIQPWQFGHPETKRTCLWLKNLSPLQPTDVVEGREGRIHKMPPSADRGKLRSITYQGIADAMAQQWG